MREDDLIDYVMLALAILMIVYMAMAIHALGYEQGSIAAKRNAFKLHKFPAKEQQPDKPA